jgi:hypothetical protein
MKTVTLELPDEAAFMLEHGDTELRRTVESVVQKLLAKKRRERVEELITLTRELQHEADINGLTDAILQEILNDK